MTPNRRDAVDWVFSNHRALFDKNINRSCDQIVTLVLKRINDPDWGRVAKSPGEGQFTPDGWKPFQVVGADGRTYTISGRSHDAIFHKPTNQQIDLLGSGNDSPDPIVDDQGQPIVARPTWGEIPQHFNRPGNVWLSANQINGEPVPQPGIPQPPVPPPIPQPPAFPPYAGDAFFTEKVGTPLQADYGQAGQSMNAGSAMWFARTIYDIMAGMTPEKSVAKHRAEWRAALGLPPL